MPKRRSSSTLSRRRSDSITAFLNIPYDTKNESLYLAFIAGLCGFGLIPRATVEISGSTRRLERILKLIRGCRYSFHDLSRVQLDRTPPATPRFNMPFELGLAVAWASQQHEHKWFVFEAVPYRLNKSLSDVDGTDPHIHQGTPRGVLQALTNALSRSHHRPTVVELETIFIDLKKVAVEIKRDLQTNSLFGARAFRDLVVVAQRRAKKRVASLTAGTKT